MNNENKIYDLLEKIYMELQDTKKELRDEISSVRNELKGDISSVNSVLKNEINSVKSDLKDFREEANTRFDNLENKLEDIEVNNANRHLTLNGHIKDMKSDISRIEMNTADNWKDIARLKSKRRIK